MTHSKHNFLNPALKLAASCALLLAVGCADVGTDDERGPLDPSGAGGAGGDSTSEASVLLPPHSDARERAEAIRRAIPGAELHFSQRTGHLMMVQGPTERLGAENPSPPKPLAETRGTSEEALLSTLLEYFARFEDAYGIEAALQTLRVAEGDEDGDAGTQFNHTVTHLANPIIQGGKKRVSVRLNHTHRGLPIDGRYATGLFDDDGNLRAVLTRLIPVPEGLDSVPSLSADDAVDTVAAELPRLVDASPELHWAAQGFEKAEHLKLLFWHPVTKLGGELRLAYEVQARVGVEVARFVVDANTGEILFGASMVPTDWHDDGDFEVTDAPDTLGNIIPIPSSVFEETRYMGYGANQVGSRFFASGHRLIIGDAANTADQGKTQLSLTPIQITTEDGNDWLSDPGYNTPHKFAATQLMLNLNKALQWWADRGWRSWDGRGSTFVANVGVNKRDDQSIPHLNAWGINGTMKIGDGTTGTGVYYGASAEVVGHEFMHNVIDATSDFRYANESGALNEALADVFGVALNAVDDRLSSAWIGADLGRRIRNMEDPTTLGDPDRYSQYWVTNTDAGGVHSNSGIFNKAHYLIIQGGTFNGAEVEAQGVEATTSILRGANQLVAWDRDTSMEEFAVGTVAFCELLAVFDSGGLADTCEAFARAYWAVELLPGSRNVDVSLESVRRIDAERFELVIRNRSRFDLRPSENYQVVFSDVMNGGASPTLSTNFDAVLAAGREVAIDAVVGPNFMLSTRERVETMTAELLPISGARFDETNTSNNYVRMDLGPDLVPVMMNWEIFGDSVGLSGPVKNLGFTGFTDGVEVALFTREAASGAFTSLDSVLGGAREGSLDPAVGRGDLARLSTTYPGSSLPSEDELLSIFTPHFVGGTSQYPGVDDPEILLQTWFDADGGRAELDGTRQLYVLLDPNDLIEETDETNNFLCVTCRGPSGGPENVVVRLPFDADTSALFGGDYAEATENLKSPLPRVVFPEPYEDPRFDEPVFRLP